MNEVKELVLNSDITLIVTTPLTKTLSIINLLNDLSIDDNNKAQLFSFNMRSEYYSRKLISFLSGINNKLITKYYYPYLGLSKSNEEKIDRDKFIDAIEKIQNSNILMSSEKIFGDEDYLDYILNYSKTDVLIIDDFYTFLEKTKYDLDEVFDRLKSKNDTHVVLVINGKNEEQEDIIEKFNRYIKNLIFVVGYNYGDYKDINMKILNNKVETNFNFKFNKNNQIIKNVEEKYNEERLCNY